MKKIAVIGAGISGMAAAYYLSRKHEVSLFEKESRLGGHTNTIDVETSRGVLPVDTGFIVHNDRTYPNLIRLLAQLGVETMASDMSFSVTCPETGFEYSSRGLRGYFAHKANLIRPAHYRLLLEIMRFNRESRALLQKPNALDTTLGEYLRQGGYSASFGERYLFPMASAIWSTSLSRIGQFPAVTLLRFFDNHGLLSLTSQPKWRVIRGGSRQYIPRITAPYQDRIYLGSDITAVDRGPQGVTLKFSQRNEKRFDGAVFACHGDQALRLIQNPTDSERDVLGRFSTSENEACLHRDSALLPDRQAARASWNYSIRSPGRNRVTVTYYMNRLQSLPTQEDYCVTLNGSEWIDPVKILYTTSYNHPLYTRDAVTAQSRWQEISGKNFTHFCGAYWFNGFHEDGLNSALRVAKALEVNPDAA